jgi:hypothetical protein
MLVTPRAKSIREAEKVFLIDLVEDGDSVCAKERSYGSVRGGTRLLVSLPRPSQPDGGEVIAKRKD